jgi:hypothetical protein
MSGNPTKQELAGHGQDRRVVIRSVAVDKLTRNLQRLDPVTTHPIQEIQSQPNNNVRSVTGRPIRK